MHKSLATITAASVLAHALFGCCNHGLAATDACASPAALCIEHSDHVHAHADRVPESGGLPCEDQVCCHLKCQWLSPDAPTDLAVGLLSHALIFDADQAASQVGAAAVGGELFTHWLLPALPVRSHLVLGVLLI